MLSGTRQRLQRTGSSANEMDRAIYKLLTYGAIVLAVAYLYYHFDPIADAIRGAVNGWWH
jgi:hypothetical protein